MNYNYSEWRKELGEIVKMIRQFDDKQAKHFDYFLDCYIDRCRAILTPPKSKDNYEDIETFLYHVKRDIEIYIFRKKATE